MKKLILLFVLLLPVSAFGDPAQKLRELNSEVNSQFKTLMLMANANGPSGANYTAALRGSIISYTAFQALDQLSLHRATVQDSGVKNTKSYKLAHAHIESLFEVHIVSLTKWIAHATKAGVVAELRDCRELFQKALKVLKETRL